MYFPVAHNSTRDGPVSILACRDIDPRAPIMVAANIIHVEEIVRVLTIPSS